jgi:hypothetical protein
MKRLFIALLAVVLLFEARASASRAFSHPDRIHYDAHCFTIDGKDVFIYSGSFHYFRCPKELWRERFQKIKDAGFNCVETYVAWNWHERDMPASLDDFSKIVKLNDLDEWLAMAEEFGFYVIARPGPYICAEWDGGGYPQWLVANKKPAQPLRQGAWLRTDDPVYLAWSKHWYQAVCPVIAKHQITRKAPGQPGVILFQIENEYDFWKQPDDVKINHLNALAKDAAAGGIDVPVITCWTKQARGVKEGPLSDVFDCTNFYPRWDIEKGMRARMAAQRAQQPDAPLMTTEMQGGWFAKVGGKLSEQQPGVTAAQIQNITLYAIQNGETAMNYYMLFGGTNFDDWAGRDLITSYDYNAPIREAGGVTERYQRVWALGHMLREHGPKLVRAEAVPVTASATDPDVEVAERRAQDGSRYLFVRTENHQAARAGVARVKEKDGSTPEWTFHYKLEPFGSMVLYLPPGVTDAKRGQWLPKPAPPLSRPAEGLLPSPVTIREAQRWSDLAPAKWTRLEPGKKVEDFGVVDRHFIEYRVAAKPGASFAVSKNKYDDVIALAGDKLLPGRPGNISKAANKDDKTGPLSMTFVMPPAASQAEILYENAGQSNFGDGMERLNGIQGVKAGGKSLALEFAVGERERGLQFSDANNPPAGVQWKTVAIAKDAAPAPDAPLAWHRMEFALPEQNPRVWAPLRLHLEASGNGFLYVNGHCIGRYWQAGPQHDFYLPDCWLNFGPGKTNAIVLSLRPANKGVAIHAASVEPFAELAEKR